MKTPTDSLEKTPERPAKRRGYGGQSAEQLAAERRERLLATALELFGTQGYAATPIERLCSAAKVTTRHFYEAFVDREALLIALFEQVMFETKTRVMAALASTAENRLAAALDAFLDAQLGDPRRARLTTIEVLGVSPRVEARRHAVISDFAQIIEAYAGALMGSGELPTRNYRVLAFGVVGAMHELQILWLNQANTLSREVLREEALFLVQAILAGAHRANHP